VVGPIGQRRNTLAIAPYAGARSRKKFRPAEPGETGIG